MTRTQVSDQAVAERQYLCFMVGQDQFAIALSNVREILEVPKMTMIPKTSSWLMGIINLRGTILSVVDISSFLSCQLNSLNESSRLIVITSKTFDLAIRVDSVQEIALVHSRDIVPSRGGLPGETALVQGICNRGGKTFSILNIEAVLNLEQLQVYM